MAARKRKKKEYAAVVGIVGAADVSLKAAKAHLSDFIEARDGEILWVFPFTENTSKSLEKVMDFLWEEEVEYVLISDGTVDAKDWEEHAQKIFEVEDDPYSALVTEVAGYEAGELGIIFLLDDELDSDVELVEAAMAEGLKCVDLGAGLQELEVEVIEEDDEKSIDVDDEDEEDEEDEVTSAPAAEIPAEVRKLIADGEYDEAADLLKEIDRDDLTDIAEHLGIEVKKGVWASTIAKEVVEELSADEAPEPEVEEADEPEEEEVVEEKPAKKKKKKAEPVEEPSAAVEPETMARPIDNGQVDVQVDIHLRTEVIRAASYVAGAQSSKEAAEFIEVLRDKGIITLV